MGHPLALFPQTPAGYVSQVRPSLLLRCQNLRLCPRATCCRAGGQRS